MTDPKWKRKSLALSHGVTDSDAGLHGPTGMEAKVTLKKGSVVDEASELEQRKHRYQATVR